MSVTVKASRLLARATATLARVGEAVAAAALLLESADSSQPSKAPRMTRADRIAAKAEKAAPAAKMTKEERVAAKAIAAVKAERLAKREARIAAKAEAAAPKGKKTASAKVSAAPAKKAKRVVQESDFPDV